MKDNVKRIQVPNKYIDNKKFHFNAFYLYVNLKMICVNNHVKIYSKKLLDNLGWSLNTFKKYLKILKQEGLVTYNFESLPIHKPIELDISPIVSKPKTKEDYFTQVDINTIQRILFYAKETKFKKYDKVSKKNIKIVKDEKEKALKLFYVYEMYYNESIGVSFPSYETIKEATGYNNTYIKAINTMFNKNDLVSVMIGDRNKETNQREKNNYIPICNRVK